MSPVVQPMTFDELCQIHREEMKGRSLTPCRSDLYRAMADLLNRLRQDYDRQISIDPDSVMSEGANLRRKKADNISKVIISLRAKKICNKAVLSADGANEDLSALTPEERDYYMQVVEMTRRQLAAVDRYRGKKTVETHIDEPIRAPEPPVEEPEAEPEAAEPIAEPVVEEVPPAMEDIEPFDEPVVQESFDEVPEPEPEPPIAQSVIENNEMPKTENMVLRVLEDLPPFVGPDRNYELRKEDIVTLPMPMAVALINSKKAVAISPGH